ncbi:hypothetical protein FOMPIDRAFT_1048972 [Fomitopsis schrenkii]|uniref:Glycopeptide n=1 Tax=Fomitopsis schrenkii TaxID=2126942 RepID=S8FIL5_FOMSC|nr:hypothetical protein FOMPIDRAFT_1048972 [Fomitopsis schrenkii]
MFSKLVIAFVAAAYATVQANAESHTVTFTNHCGKGTPTLKSQNGQTLSTGGAYTSDGAALGLIAYLQTGQCGNNGEGCTLVEVTLENGKSAADISLIPPHAFSVASGFNFNACDNAGTDCTDANCPKAYRHPNDNFAVVGCGADNVNIDIKFCD